MRFILAIFAFVVATALIGIGIAERTVLLPPSSLSVSTATSGTSPYLYIDSSVLQAESGNQTLTLGGSSKVFAAYGRTDDVKAWLNGSAYDSIGYSAGSGSDDSLTSTTVAATPDGEANVASGSSNPDGSDLWLEQYTSDGTMNRTFNLPAGYSLIVADDGTAPAPTSVQISWPLDDSTPLAVPFLLAGAFFLLAGLVLLILGLHHLRKSQGPRRKPPALPRGRGKRFSSSRHNAIESGVGRRGRRSISRSVAVIAPVALLTSLAFGGQAYAEVTPTPGSTPATTSTPTPTPDVATAEPTPAPTSVSGPPPAVTEAQLNGILTKISATTNAADAASDATALATRFTGPALDLRTETYTIRKTYPAYAAPQAIPAAPASLTLPQATDSWPRTVFTIVSNPDDKTIAPLSLMLVQETPRSVYKVYYAIALEPDTTIPPVAPPTIGTSRLSNDTKLLSETPADVAAGYADILAVGQASTFFDQFDATGDTLRTSVGADYKAEKKAGLQNTAVLEYAKVAGTGESIALATNQSGAIVALNIRESETARVVVPGATVKTEGAVTVASGVLDTPKGTEAIYDYQLLFYIPPSGDASKVRLLGFAQGLLSAKELP
ncbi:hypothetical protein [Subtercola boreus]|uniref:DUF8094 domain-containing protein n=1 Tax=Subtercola boreus TaxID=120213 RepID=A0A3E0WEP7_9MICO|nr:hypothetical protein [Subtercola boreus]RFA22042.1 hypothetical protein B7R24_04975 [Subtercola boreus]RFA22222.1 hypothetical protein B7R23_04920 [Subtercola boreus]RFA28085.1 hypothetical protein B7R25_05045 [Subtercola boreus]